MAVSDDNNVASRRQSSVRLCSIWTIPVVGLVLLLRSVVSALLMIVFGAVLLTRGFMFQIIDFSEGIQNSMLW
ncbi:hypothetical protein Ancab_034589 [Ancistrocladus abbreviatus]